MKGSVIITSQVDPTGWFKLFQDPVIAEAIVDRLTKPALQLRFEVKDSYRGRVKYKKELGSESTLQQIRRRQLHHAGANLGSVRENPGVNTGEIGHPKMKIATLKWKAIILRTCTPGTGYSL